MPVPIRSTSALRELDHRRSGAVNVTLLWSRDRPELLVCVADDNTGDHFVITAQPSEALTAFNHPYAFAARHHHRLSGRVPALIRANAAQGPS
jgi:hypothetical protein